MENMGSLYDLSTRYDSAASQIEGKNLFNLKVDPTTGEIVEKQGTWNAVSSFFKNLFCSKETKQVLRADLLVKLHSAYDADIQKIRALVQEAGLTLPQQENDSTEGDFKRYLSDLVSMAKDVKGMKNFDSDAVAAKEIIRSVIELLPLELQEGARKRSERLVPSEQKRIANQLKHVQGDRIPVLSIGDITEIETIRAQELSKSKVHTGSPNERELQNLLCAEIIIRKYEPLLDAVYEKMNLDIATISEKRLATVVLQEEVKEVGEGAKTPSGWKTVRGKFPQSIKPKGFAFQKVAREALEKARAALARPLLQQQGVLLTDLASRKDVASFEKSATSAQLAAVGKRMHAVQGAMKPVLEECEKYIELCNKGIVDKESMRKLLRAERDLLLSQHVRRAGEGEDKKTASIGNLVCSDMVIRQFDILLERVDLLKSGEESLPKEESSNDLTSVELLRLYKNGSFERGLSLIYKDATRIRSHTLLTQVRTIEEGLPKDKPQSFYLNWNSGMGSQRLVNAQEACRALAEELGEDQVKEILTELKFDLPADGFKFNPEVEL